MPMIHPWHDVTPGSSNHPLPGHFRAVIEIPKGSHNKYELDKRSGMIKLDRVLSSAVYYPANYGFIPQTLADDDDPLDVLVFSAEEVVPMCLVEARAVGLMTMIDDGQADHKVIAVLEQDPIYDDYKSASDFPRHTFKMLKRFLEDYKVLEGKDVEVDEIMPAEAAHPIIENALNRYSDERRQGRIPGLHS